MAPSASKQKRLAEKAAKAALKQKEQGTTEGSSTAVDSAPPSSSGTTPMASTNASTEEISMAKLALATDRSVRGRCKSQPQT